MIRIEQQQIMFSTFRVLLGKTTKGSLASLTVPEIDTTTKQPTGKFVTIFDPEEIEARIIKRNQQHFSQVSGAPLARAPYVLAIGRNAEHGMDGALEALSRADDEALAALLEQILAYWLPQIACEISTDQVISRFKCWKERTLTSPQGNHLGHYHALLVPDPPELRSSEGPDEPIDPLRHRAVFKVMSTLLTTAFKHGVVASRWLLVFNAMLEKIPGNPLINKLRVIHLFDCLSGISA